MSKRTRLGGGAISALFILGLGIIFATLALALAQEALKGNLNTAGWLVLIGSVFVFVLLFYQSLSKPGLERTQYLHLLRASPIAKNPSAFIASAPVRALSFSRFFGGAADNELTLERLPQATRYIKTNASAIQQDPELVALAAAYLGEILRTNLDGRWRVWRKGKYRDAVVCLGQRALRHEVSPGLMVFRVAQETDFTLEGFLEHESRELT